MTKIRVQDNCLDFLKNLVSDLLHKPVARVQKNALVLHDLLKYTNEELTEYKSLKTALKMTQCFLNDLNIAATEQMFPVVNIFISYNIQLTNQLNNYLSINRFKTRLRGV